MERDKLKGDPNCSCTGHQLALPMFQMQAVTAGL